MSALLLALLAVAPASAGIDPKCADEAAADPPSWYVDDQHQQDFLLNFFSLSTSFSALHGVLPNEPGHGSIGLEASIIPALNCDRRLVFDRSKTEDTNKAPLLPRPRLQFTLPKLGPVALYAGLGYVPPLTLFGTRNVIISGEAGIGVPLESGIGFGARYHFTMLKTIAEVATPFEDGGDAYQDFYSGSTFGLDGMFGYKTKYIEPYLAAGFTDVSTFFWIGDDGVVGNNSTPYFGFSGSVGAQVHWRRIDGAAEFYTAPGYVYTGRLRIGVSI